MKTLTTLEAEPLATPDGHARAGLAPVVTAECCDGAWTVFWDEPVGGKDWEAYAQAAEAVLIPAMQARWSEWKLAKATARSVVLLKSPHGLIRGITEACARDVVALTQNLFPDAVVTWRSAED